MNGQADNEALARLIVAIEPWLGEVAIIGGWAHRLYRFHPSAQALYYENQEKPESPSDL
jgi:hypothetical protein